MGSLISRAAAGALLALSASFVSAASGTVLSFDDIAGIDDYAAVPTGYGGLDWSQSSWSVLTAAQAPYTAHSGDGRLTLGWGSSDASSTIRFAQPAVFDGAWFAGYSEATVRFDLYSAGQLVASSTTLALSATPTYLASGWSGTVDAVVVSSPLHAFYVMDDLGFTAVSNVPEPAGWMLMLAGGACLVRVVRRRA